MIRAIADTHALIWYLFDDKRLSRPAKQFMDNAAKSGEQIGFSAISVIEIVYWLKKKKSSLRLWSDCSKQQEQATRRL